MKTLQQHEIEITSGGLELWRPRATAPLTWGLPMSEWVWLLDEVSAPDPTVPSEGDPPIICPPWEPDTFYSA